MEVNSIMSTNIQARPDSAQPGLGSAARSVLLLPLSCARHGGVFWGQHTWEHAGHGEEGSSGKPCEPAGHTSCILAVC